MYVTFCMRFPSRILIIPFITSVFTGTVMTESNIHLSGIRDLEEHAIRRRPWVRGLAPPALREYEEIGAARINQLVSRLAEQKGIVTLGQWFNYLAYVMLLLSSLSS